MDESDRVATEGHPYSYVREDLTFETKRQPATLSNTIPSIPPITISVEYLLQPRSELTTYRYSPCNVNPAQ